MQPIRAVVLALAASVAAVAHPVSAQESEFLESLLADVERLASQSNTERGEILQAILSERGIEFALHTFEVSTRANYPRILGTNIIVTLGEGREDLVIGGHYDAAWLADGSLSPGAVDNAASAVILTRVAESLAARPLGVRVRVVFYDMEEIGLLGSREFVERHADDPIAAAINLDVNGYGDTIFYTRLPDRPEGPVNDAIEKVCAGSEFDCRAFARYPASDYLSFQRAGIPYVSLAILPEDEVDELDAALNGTRPADGLGEPPRIFSIIHSPDDRPELVDPAAMAITYRAVLALVAELNPAAE